MSSPAPDRRLLPIALLLFGSGTTGLIYQVAWLRELRLIFGASTAASAAVLAIFMGGLGLGGALLGPRADRVRRPLLLYAHLELLVAVAAGLSPLLLDLARASYVAVGGTSVLGPQLATLIRLLLSALILGLPTVLMGGTLPAATRAVETEGDAGRTRLALLYGANTLGAVTGATGATFLLLELYGTRRTLLLAVLFNALIGVLARAYSRRLGARPAEEEPAPPPSEPGPANGLLRPGLVYAAAATVGFVFLLMELVWYRMLSPLLGGTTFTFGLILAVALLGIGLGGAAYALVGRDFRPTPRLFALTCLAEAFCLALPWALGDRVAYLAQFLRSFGALGFYGHVAGWFVVTLLVVLPAALVSGLQFPLLVALLGKGEHDVGRQLGRTYAWNTLGAILGSLAGGFGLLAALSAPGTWRLCVLLLVSLALASTLFDPGRRPAERSARRLWLLAAVPLLLILARGPTAFWRHNPIGAGRVQISAEDPNGLRAWEQQSRGRVLWEREGRESSVAVVRHDSLAFLINGKSDGNARQDAPTQVWLGLVGAALHPHPERGMVIGLGTGSSAGWLAAVEELERVDVVELEPVVVEVARATGPVNHGVLENPKVHLQIGDAREVLLTTPETYDIIASEPSNPYRAGISSLFTREFYDAAAARLRPGGIFLQWLQGYEVDNETVETILATLRAVFPKVEVWQTHPADLLLVASEEQQVIDVPRLRRRLQREPFRSALLDVWRTGELEGFLARFVADASLVDQVAELAGDRINTDDHNLVEFGFARTVGRSGLFNVEEIRHLARLRSADRPTVAGGEVDWGRLEEERLVLDAISGGKPEPGDWLEEEQRLWSQVLTAYLASDGPAVLGLWEELGREARGPWETLMLAHASAAVGPPETFDRIEALRRYRPEEAEALLGLYHHLHDRYGEATEHLVRALEGFRAAPWAWAPLVTASLKATEQLARQDDAYAQALFEALRDPFSVYILEQERRRALLSVALQVDLETAVSIFASYEPWVPWNAWYLTNRFLAYQAVDHPFSRRAESELGEFLRWQRRPFGEGLMNLPSSNGQGIEPAGLAPSSSNDGVQSTQ